MTRLVDDLLDVSRIRCGKIELQKELLDLTEVITDAIELNRDFIEIRKHQLSVSQPAVPVVVDGDRVRLTQVVSNLLHNAAKYMPDGGQIGVLIDQFEEHAVIRVKDTGVGIAPAMLSRVFDLFVQADESLDRSQGGLGLGLTLVRQLVELHGGTVEAFSAGLQQGSEFMVRLPLVRDAAARLSESREDAGSLADAAACRILIVDDNEDAAAMLAELLGLLGHEVQCVHDGHSAFDVLDSFRPEVVLLDIGLPGMDGYQVAAQIRQKYTRDAMLLIALTGYGHEQAVQRGREAGFDHHLVKPLDLHALSKLLAQPRIPRGVE
jgi:CheY-like chemotaxis protein